MFFCKCVHESTITCMFPCITPVSAHCWPPLEKGPLLPSLIPRLPSFFGAYPLKGRLGTRLTSPTPHHDGNGYQWLTLTCASEDTVWLYLVVNSPTMDTCRMCAGHTHMYTNIYSSLRVNFSTERYVVLTYCAVIRAASQIFPVLIQGDLIDLT